MSGYFFSTFARKALDEKSEVLKKIKDSNSITGYSVSTCVMYYSRAGLHCKVYEAVGLLILVPLHNARIWRRLLVYQTWRQSCGTCGLANLELRLLPGCKVASKTRLARFWSSPRSRVPSAHKEKNAILIEVSVR